jgi:hypothetical protein
LVERLGLLVAQALLGHTQAAVGTEAAAGTGAAVGTEAAEVVAHRREQMGVAHMVRRVVVLDFAEEVQQTYFRRHLGELIRQTKHNCSSEMSSERGCQKCGGGGTC